MGAPQKYRQRYIAFKIDESLSRGGLINIINDLSEELNYSPSPWLTLYDSEKREGLIRCNHQQVDELKEVLKKKKKPNFEIEGVSGTIKKARQKFLSNP